MCYNGYVSMRASSSQRLTYRSAWADSDVGDKGLSHSMRCASASGARRCSACHASRSTEHRTASCAGCALLAGLQRAAAGLSICRRVLASVRELCL